MAEPEMMAFLRALQKNNSLAWMAENKPWQRRAAAQFEGLVQNLLLALSQDDPALAGLPAKGLIARLNRDTRFGADKSPYHCAFRAHLSTAGRQPVPVGYYLYLSPGRSFLGGGLFAALPGAPDRVRQAILERPADVEAALAQPIEVRGEKLKNVPAGYAKDHPLAESLKHKSWYIEDPVPDEALQDLDAFCADAARRFLQMRPLNDFLNRALSGYRLPDRK